MLVLCLFSCQKEERIITPVTTEEGFLEGNSTLLHLLRAVALKDGSADNAIDSTSSLSVVFPIQVKINGILQDIDSAGVVKEKMKEYSDELEIIYPLITISSTFSEITFFDEEQLRQYREGNPPPNDIEAVDIEYPISFASYSLITEIAETIYVENDKDLFLFLKNLSEESVASLNFPVVLNYFDGRSVKINSNAELETALQDYPSDYDDEDDPYNQEEIKPGLLECSWAFGKTGHVLKFQPDGTFAFSLGGFMGSWELQVGKEDILKMHVENGKYPFEGEWLITSFKRGKTGYILYFDNNGNDLTMSQDCPKCTTTISQCETQPGFAQFNLNAYMECAIELAGLGAENATVEYYDSQQAAENEDNPINNTIAYTNQTPGSQTIYARVEDPTTQQFTIIAILLQVKDC